MEVWRNGRMARPPVHTSIRPYVHTSAHPPLAPSMKSRFAYATLALAAAACTKAGMSPMSSGSGPDMSQPLVVAPSPDPRVGLKAGLQDAGEAIWNLRMVSHTPAPQGFAGVTNSDLAFSGTDVIQGNYNGFQIWDISDPAHPRLRDATLCPASQSDVSVYRN